MKLAMEPRESQREPAPPEPVPAELVRELPALELAALSAAEALLASYPPFAAAGIALYRPHPAVLLAARAGFQVIITQADAWKHTPAAFLPFKDALSERRASVCLLGVDATFDVTTEAGLWLAAALSLQPSGPELHTAVVRGLELLESRSHAESRGTAVARYETEMGELVDIARAISTQRNVDTLLGVVLQKCRLVTNADAGSIYVIETTERGAHLRFKFTQNDSVSFDSTEFTMPISTRSIAGAVALDKKAISIDNVYELPSSSPFGFDRSFDERVGYTTRSMLTLPLISQQDEVIGIIQLINRKRTVGAVIRTQADADTHVLAFDAKSEGLVGMVAAQAGVSLENALLYEEIQGLFESFVKASVEAIESRDPTTSGHSRRVANLTVELAKTVDHIGDGPFKLAHFSRDDLREIEYASLLHDFGKIGVREKVLVKSKKLYDDRLDVVRMRFEYAWKAMEVELLQRKLAMLEKKASADELVALDQEYMARRAALESSLELVLSANEPTVQAAGDFARIEELAKETFVDSKGQMRRMLEDDDVLALSITRGSLTASEYQEITSHVSHTYRFLSRIPWGKKLRHVPRIAGAHHERLNGTGYPNKLRADEIPIQSKMMSVADIFDALTASDRPYKRAVPVEKALEILDFSVKDGHIDGDLVRIFRDSRVWERAWGDSPPPASLRSK